MAPTHGPETKSLTAELSRDPGAYDFFQAIRLLQRRWEEYPRIGYAHLPAREPLRFGETATLGFASTLIDRFSTPEGKPAKLSLSYHGLLGANGPLPTAYTEYAIERAIGHRDTTIPAFLDIFHHRMMSFLARAWTDSNIAADMDRPADSRFECFVGCLAGKCSSADKQENALPSSAHLYFSGWLSRDTRSLEGLEKILGDFFSVPTRVDPFQGRWLGLPDASRSQLGRLPATGTLGQSVILGESVWDCRLSFRVKCGPLLLEDFRRLLPGGESYRRFCAWIKLYTGLEYFWDLQLALRSEETPSLALGAGARLGYDTWLQAVPARVSTRNVLIEPRSSNTPTLPLVSTVPLSFLSAVALKPLLDVRN